MNHHHAVFPKTPSCDIDAVGAWLERVAPGYHLSVVAQLMSVERHVLHSSRIRGRVEFAYTGAISEGAIDISVQILVDTTAVNHGSISLACSDGRFFKTYSTLPDSEGRTEQVSFFADASDAAQFLSFAARPMSASKGRLSPRTATGISRSRLAYRRRKCLLPDAVEAAEEAIGDGTITVPRR